MIPGPVAPDVSAFSNTFDDSRLLMYQHNLVDWHGYIKFLGLNSTKETTEDMELEALYVVPHLASAPLRAQEVAGTSERTKAAMPVLEALRDQRRVVVLGEPGSGKSTLVSWLAASLLRGGGAGPALRSALGNVVPLPLILRELDSSGLDGTFQSLLKAFLKRPVAAALDMDGVLALLERGQAFLLLDGIDELGNVAARIRLREAVWDGWRRFPKARWLLTSRLVGYEECPFDKRELSERERKLLETVKGGASLVEAAAAIGGVAAGVALHGEVNLPLIERAGKAVLRTIKNHGMVQEKPEEPCILQIAPLLYVAPFNDAEIDQFAGNWFLRYERNEKLRPEAVRVFLESVRAHPHIKELARNPILLTFMALVHRAGVRLPDGRANLYGKICESYLESIHLYRGLHLNPDLHVALTLDEKELVLSYVGYQAQLQRHQDALGNEEPGAGPADAATGEVLIPLADLRQWMGEALALTNTSSTEVDATVEQTIRFMGQRTGLLVPRGEGRYAFMHLTFQEYFCACWFARRMKKREWQNGSWHYRSTAQMSQAPDSLYAWRQYVRSALWHETLLLLYELHGEEDLLFGLFAKDQRAANDAAGLASLRAAMTRKESESAADRRDAVLLGAIAMDPHAQVPEGLRREVLGLCWRFVEPEVTTQLMGRECPDLLLRLTSSGSYQPLSLSVLAERQDLTVLNLAHCAGLMSIDPLARLSSLKVLILNGCTGLTSIDPLVRLSNLAQLYLSGCTGLTSIDPVGELSTLTELGLGGCTGLTSIDPVIRLSNLRFLGLGGWTGMTSIDPVGELSNLEYLVLYDCAGLRSISPVVRLSNLKMLLLIDCTGLTSIDPVGELSNLGFLYLNGCTGLTSIDPVIRLSKLKYLSLRGCTGLPEETAAMLKGRLPGCKID